ncbi:MAG: ion transporter [Kangiellaceae bacterium]|nr:ion transporter [Kangiellaceae bacterium]
MKNYRPHDFDKGEPLVPWREKIHEVIFEAETPAGKAFDVVLIISIFASVIAVMLDSVESIATQYGTVLFIAEWAFTILFTIEYILRLISVRRPLLYARSFYGIVDLLSIIPTYLTLFLVDAKYFLVIRILRVLRIFRIFKLASYMGEANLMVDALKNSREKISVFLYAVILMVVIFGSIMYVLEGPENGFHNIPQAVYWAIVTLTTVGYGDIAPHTPLGQFIASAIMIMGYGIIAVPTGIYSAELTRQVLKEKDITNNACPSCSFEGHDKDAVHCKKCGTKL